jgi:hypothetical protein
MKPTRYATLLLCLFPLPAYAFEVVDHPEPKGMRLEASAVKQAEESLARYAGVPDNVKITVDRDEVRVKASWKF